MKGNLIVLLLEWMELIQLFPYLVSSHTCRGGGRKKIILENYHQFFLMQTYCLCFLTPDCICYGNVFGFSTLISCFPSFSCWCSGSLSWSDLTWSAVMDRHMYDDQWYSVLGVFFSHVKMKTGNINEMLIHRMEPL